MEIDFTAEVYRDKMIDTIYIGGGTPTTLEPEELERLLGKLERSFDLEKVKEFTVEAGRADSITAEKLAVLKARGVTRISVNPQTMKDETLKLIGYDRSAERTFAGFLDGAFSCGKAGEPFEGVDRGAWSFHAGKYGGNDADRRGRGEGAFHEALLSLQAEKYVGQF